MPPRNATQRDNGVAKSGGSKPPVRRPLREVFLHAGLVVIRARLLATPTADSIWAGLPIYGTAERRGDLVHFECRIAADGEPDASSRVAAGLLAYWPDERRVLVGFGETRLSLPGEVRLPCVCNVWAVALDDVRQLATVESGQNISILEAAS